VVDAADARGEAEKKLISGVRKEQGDYVTNPDQGHHMIRINTETRASLIHLCLVRPVIDYGVLSFW
jgi:hypothetical protein